MSSAIAADTRVWSGSFLRRHPLRLAGIVLNVVFRLLFGVFWLAAGINKVRKDWLSTDILLRIFEDRLTEMPPDSFQVAYLQLFAIPLYKAVAWVVTFGELYVGVALLLGLTTRWAAAVGLFILVNFSLGGYYDASLIPFYLLSLIFITTRSGHWLGLDGRLARKYPGSRWFA
ncbi:MAG: DoxX family protein [Gammaproteobacteria bacterium]|nr:DoxX family protein [Gammaproteobacteria bacterium]